MKRGSRNTLVIYYYYYYYYYRHHHHHHHHHHYYYYYYYYYGDDDDDNDDDYLVSSFASRLDQRKGESFTINPVQVVAFRLREWCMLGVILQRTFTQLGDKRQDLFSP